MTKVICTSDLHGFLPVIEACDILLIGGDICPIYNHDVPFQRQWLDTNFRGWLEECRASGAKNIVGVWGNHDLIGQCPHLIPEGLAWTLLEGNVTEAAGLAIWGGPWQLRFGGGFNLEELELNDIYKRIPEGVDIVLSHGPPFMYGDKAPRQRDPNDNRAPYEHAGSVSLTARLLELKPKLAVFGHIHEGAGCYEAKGIKMVNASFVNGRYNPSHPPTWVDL